MAKMPDAQLLAAIEAAETQAIGEYHGSPTPKEYKRRKQEITEQGLV